MNDHPPIESLLDLSGRVALVTGASGNLGQGIAARLAEAGAHVVAHCRRARAAADALRDRIADAGGACSVVEADLESAADIEAMFAAFDDDGVEVDVVVNNAAAQPVAPFEAIDIEAWRQMMAANLDSAFLITRLAAASMRARGAAGAIVNVASIEGSDPAVAHAHYATSKAGLLMLTRAAALEIGGGIRVNAVSPGLIDRDGLAADWPDGVARWLDKAPLGRLGAAADVADAVLFLCSPASRWISGANLVVDGGMSCVSRW